MGRQGYHPKDIHRTTRQPYKIHFDLRGIAFTKPTKRMEARFLYTVYQKNRTEIDRQIYKKEKQTLDQYK